MKNKITLINMISTLLLQLITIVSGFIIPKIILSYFGSNVNGLVSSLTQFLNYIALVEGGITGVVMANLYKPLYKNDTKKISSIVKTTNIFYKKIGLIFIIYTIVLATVYPLAFNTDFSYVYVFSLTLILSLSLLIQYMFSLTFRNLLNADKKVYIVSFTQSGILILNIIFAIISVYLYPSIHLLKILTGFVYIIQPLIFNNYVKKHYTLDNNANPDNELLKSRWDGFAINVAAFIHNGTDIAVLTIFSNLGVVSVYSVYALVTSGLRQIVNSLTTGINPTIGQAYAKNDMKELNQKMDIYEYIIFILVFFLFTVGGLLITPFVMIYTKGITDANYYEPLFGALLLIAEAIYLLKLPHLNLAYSANKFKDITKPAFIEAFLNIIISVILVSKYGIIGVAVGTLVSMIYRMIFHIRYTNKLIENRKQWIFYRKLIIFVIGTLIGLGICYFIPQVKYTIFSWIIHAIIYSIIFAIIYSIISVLFFKKELKFFKGYLFRKKGDKNV